MLAAVLLAGCGKAPEGAAGSLPQPPVTPVVSEAEIDAEMAEALAGEPATAGVSDHDALADKAEDVLDKYPRKNAEELLNVPEVNESLKVALTKLSQDKALQNQINATVELAAQMKGLSGEPGTVGLDLDVKGYDRARTSRMIQAVLSEDPKRIVAFLTEEIGEATPEISYGGVDRARNGVAIKEQAPPQRPANSQPD